MLPPSGISASLTPLFAPVFKGVLSTAKSNKGEEPGLPLPFEVLHSVMSFVMDRTRHMQKSGAALMRRGLAPRISVLHYVASHRVNAGVRGLGCQ